MPDTLVRTTPEPASAELRPPALFLDFDGTLVDIAPTPDAVRIHPAVGPALVRLRDALGGALAIVSGRSIAVLDAFLAPHRFDAAGLHGVERRLDGRLEPCDPASHPDLRRALTAMRARFDGAEGVLVEDKGCSFALHWRLAPERGDEVAAAAAEIAAALGARYRLQRGKAVAEILPADAAKAAVIGRFLDDAPYRGRRPVFIGDDLTDEGGFAAVDARGGVSVRIGAEPTGAARRVASPAAFRSLLTAWAEAGRIDLQDLPPA